MIDREGILAKLKRLKGNFEAIEPLTSSDRVEITLRLAQIEDMQKQLAQNMEAYENDLVRVQKEMLEILPVMPTWSLDGSLVTDSHMQYLSPESHVPVYDKQLFWLQKRPTKEFANGSLCSAIV